MRRDHNTDRLLECIRSNQLQRYMSSDLSAISELIYFDKNEYLIQADFHPTTCIFWWMGK